MKRLTIGIDEVGRGALAGPVIACAVLMDKKFSIRLSSLRDSKRLSMRKREEIFLLLKDKLKWAQGRVSHSVIDKINIERATKLAMARALKNLLNKLSDRSFSILLYIDGNSILPHNYLRPMKHRYQIIQKALVKGDEILFPCKIASIFAKVIRDRMMIRLSTKFFQYGFHKHKGYGTKFHFQMIKKYGPCKIHRLSFLSNIGF